jgi:hypothetical protein
MQIIEQTGLFGVRSAVLTFERSGCATRFVVVPMLHIGLPEFYREVQERLDECDVVVAEGVAGVRTRIVTLAYRLAGRVRRGGLVQQSRALDLSRLSGTVVCPDLSAREFATGWARVARWLRWGLLVMAPLFGLWMLMVGPRRVLGSDLTIEDQLSAQEEEYSDEQLDALLVDTRDRVLIAELGNQIQGHADDPTPWMVGVCWGAAHVRAVAPALLKQGFQIRKAEWVSVL